MYIERGPEKKMIAWDPKWPRGNPNVVLKLGWGPNFHNALPPSSFF